MACYFLAPTQLSVLRTGRCSDPKRFVANL